MRVPDAGVIAVRVVPGSVHLGRPVLVAVSLADLRGPSSGMVELPLHLYWSGLHGWFSLDDPAGRRRVYTIVLREACSPDDLAAFVDGSALTAVWPDMILPGLVRKAWEDQRRRTRRTAGSLGCTGPYGSLPLRRYPAPGRRSG